MLTALGTSPPSGAAFAGLAKAPEPAALPLPSFGGFARSQSDLGAPRHPAAPALSAADASTQLRQLLALPMPASAAPPAYAALPPTQLQHHQQQLPPPPQPSVAAQHTDRKSVV